VRKSDGDTFGSLVEAVREADQTGEFDEEAFGEGLGASLAAGAFRLVLVLDARVSLD
jgi:hypothetical protein